MEGIPLFDFAVRSSVHDYQVSFVEDTPGVLLEELKDGDVIIIDNQIIDLYGTELKAILDVHKYIGIDANETQKSYQGIMPVIEDLIEGGFRKNHRLVGIGGGITQDVTAFISSMLYRGVQWLFFPTTLLAQGDSCIGSKTSINFGNFKNQVGGFYPPRKIFINLKYLKTLSESDLKSGLGEMCHYFVVAGEADFRRYKRDYAAAMEDDDVLASLVARSLEIKKGYIEIDEFDRNERQVFNYGHSFGHAIESLTDYRIPHGIAVSYGMDMANFVSVKMGLIPESIRRDIRELLEQVWEGTSIDDISLDKFKLALSKDKKNVGKELRLILNGGYGKIFKAAVQMDDHLILWLTEYFENELE